MLLRLNVHMHLHVPCNNACDYQSVVPWLEYFKIDYYNNMSSYMYSCTLYSSITIPSYILLLINKVFITYLLPQRHWRSCLCLMVAILCWLTEACLVSLPEKTPIDSRVIHRCSPASISKDKLLWLASLLKTSHAKSAEIMLVDYRYCYYASHKTSNDNAHTPCNN